ncbi:MAG: serine hydrolase domain-containing protein [Chitinophagaceae bacterium]
MQRAAKQIVFTFSFLLIAYISSSQSTTLNDTLKQIDKLFEDMNTATPGGVLSVSRQGEILYKKGFGMADLEHNVVITPETIFEAGSVSKQFTAASVLLLVKEGRIGLKDDIRKYFPDFPDYGHPILVEHLLHHTSGLRDWGSVAAIGGWPRGTRKYTPAHVREIIWKQKKLNFVPGSEYSYSNSNFNMLMFLVEKVSGESLQQFTSEHLFKPLGMSHTRWRDNYNAVVPGRAIAYGKEGENYEQNMPFENTFGHGALLTTVGDLEKWNRRWTNNAIGADINALQETRGILNNGATISYACGVVINTVNGQKEISHTGATAGYRALLAYYPEKQVSIIYLSNDAGAPLGRIYSFVSEMFIGKTPEKAMYESKPIAVSKESLVNKAGTYQHPLQYDLMELVVRNDSLAFKNWNTALTPMAENKFINGNTLVEFPAGGTKSGSVFITWADGDTATYFRAKEVDAKASVEEYAGDYHSDEADVTVSLLVKEGKLQAFIHPDTYIKLNEPIQDGFFDEDGSYYRFIRNSKKKITGFEITVSRVRNLLFTKIK